MKPYLYMQNITKEYTVNRVVANRNVDFQVERGEIHALVGENGAGKTTLVKILDGIEQADTGRIIFNGSPVSIRSPRDGFDLGIGMVHQHLRLIPEFSIAENVVLGSEPKKYRWLYDSRTAIERVRKVAEENGFRLDPQTPVRELSANEMQQVEIIKVLYRQAELIILDEPTAILSQDQVMKLFSTLRNLVKRGRTIIFISHKLKEVLDISDRITVMRGGRVVAVRAASELQEHELSHLMVEEELARPARTQSESVGRVVYELCDASLHLEKQEEPALRKINLQVHEGEIVGVTGVSGNGLSELEDTVSGLIRRDSQYLEGELFLNNEEVSSCGPEALRRRHMAYVPSNRLYRGVCLESSVRDNLIIKRTNGVFRFGLLDGKRARSYTARLLQKYSIAATPDLPIGILSGGNIQKVILARELEGIIEFLLISEPTWGVDVASSTLIHNEILRLKRQGTAILLISTDLDEVLSISDSIAVLYRGQIIQTFKNSDSLSKRNVGKAMLGMSEGINDQEVSDQEVSDQEAGDQEVGDEG